MDENPSVTPAPLQPQQAISRVIIPESKTIKIIRTLANITISLGYIAEIVIVVPLTLFSIVLMGTMACDNPNSDLCKSHSFSDSLGFPIAIQTFMLISAVIFITTIFGKQTEIKKAIHWISALPLLYFLLQLALNYY